MPLNKEQIGLIFPEPCHLLIWQMKMLYDWQKFYLWILLFSKVGKNTHTNRMCIWLNWRANTEQMNECEHLHSNHFKKVKMTWMKLIGYKEEISIAMTYKTICACVGDDGDNIYVRCHHTRKPVFLIMFLCSPSEWHQYFTDHSQVEFSLSVRL